MENKNDKLIKNFSSSIIKGLYAKIEGATRLKHNLQKGELTELFVSNVLKHFLPRQFDIGSGTIVNSKGDQSSQSDIIIYDNRILPPFIREQHLGVFPAESVVGVIEVKTKLGKQDIIDSENAAKKLIDEVFNKNFVLTNFPDKWESIRKPLYGTIGFYGAGSRELKMKNTAVGIKWLKINIIHNFAFCIVGKYSWVRVTNPNNSNVLEWRKSDAKPISENRFEETKRFISILIDNLWTISACRMNLITSDPFFHTNRVGSYIRDEK